MSRMIVYTAILGGYDYLPKIVSNGEEIEYYCFTDSIPENTNGWTCILIPSFFKDNKLNIGYLKTNPQLLFPWDSIVVWIDSNIDEVDLTKAKVHALLQDDFIASLPHRDRQTVFGEIAVVREYNLDNRNKLSKWEMELKSIEYPDKDNLAELAFLIRDIRRTEVRQFNKTWWRFLLNGSRRDQLSFNPALWYHNLSWRAIKVDDNETNRSDYFKYTFRGHTNPKRRSVPNSSPALKVDDFAPFCWTEFHSSQKESGIKKEHYLCQQEYWTKETLESVRSINQIVSDHKVAVNENYFFIEQEYINQYSVSDIRYGWKREYLRKAIIPANFGIEIGFRQGHSAALMLGYNPFLSILAIEPSPNQTTYACAEKLVAIYHTRLEVYYGNTAKTIALLSEKFPLSKIEFIHYNSSPVFNPEEFWEFMEWYLCHASPGCRLVISDMNTEISSVVNILYHMANIDYLDPGIPFITDARQLIKVVNMHENQLQELKSWYASQNQSEVKETKFRANNLALRKTNEELDQKNSALQKEIERLNEYNRQFEKPVAYFLNKLKKKTIRVLKKIVKL